MELPHSDLGEASHWELTALPIGSTTHFFYLLSSPVGSYPVNKRCLHTCYLLGGDHHIHLWFSHGLVHSQRRSINSCQMSQNVLLSSSNIVNGQFGNRTVAHYDLTMKIWPISKLFKMKCMILFISKPTCYGLNIDVSPKLM